MTLHFPAPDHGVNRKPLKIKKELPRLRQLFLKSLTYYLMM